ncbi:hypothetical protein AI3057V1_1485 [Citrobacter freundii]|uniref:acyltransferase family protein n=1 Tax=Citrobacter freundii TaxID=546 RepID=UPI001DDCB6BE|nr:acyltransferase family protein [Citrobacter freundii]CAG0338816.1 hypothetical protein AI3057V1_1485 [Citrobacter freundii]CAH6020984.1 hypothetical protein AI3057V1_1485 [Citrobacter freundii]
MFTKDQSISLDYAKALGIISVVIGHYNLTPFSIPHPYYFHMPLFFFIGGMLINTKKSFTDVFRSIFRKHIIYIALTYVFIGIITKILILSIGANLSDPLKGGVSQILFAMYHTDFHVNSLFLVAWFLLAYALSSIVSFSIIRMLSGVSHASYLILISSVSAGYLGMVHFPEIFNESKNVIFNYISQAFSGAMFMMLGYLLKDFIFKYQNIYGMLFSLIVVSYLINSGLVQPMTMSWSSYPGGFASSTINALLCIYLVFSASTMLQKTSGNCLFLYIGRSSKTIMSYHLLVLYLIDLFLSNYGLVDTHQVNALNHFYNPYVWPAYFILPLVLLPLANQAYSKCRSIISHKLFSVKSFV